MTIQIVQTAFSASAFNTATTAGNTVFIFGGGFNEDSSVMATSGPILGGESVTGASHLTGDAVATFFAGSSQGQLATLWMLPNVPGGQETFSLTITNGSFVELGAMEVSGLGTAPTFDQGGTYGSPSAGSETVTIGPIGETTEPSELALVMAASFAGFFGGPNEVYWTGEITGSTHAWFGYSIQTSPSAYSFTNPNIGSASANAGVIATVISSAVTPVPSDLLFLVTP